MATSQQPQTYGDILPNPGFAVTRGNTAVVISDPQKDFLSEKMIASAVVTADEIVERIRAA